MPSAAARRLYEDQIPSFMSIIDSEGDTTLVDGSDVVTVVDSKYLDMEPTCAPHSHFPGANPQPQQLHHHLHTMQMDPLHRHNDSTSTQNSADSSPTTTLTTDTSSLSDPSPSSSPDSPINLIPLNNFPGTSFGGLSSTMNTLTVSEPNAINNHFQRPMTSPSPRRRNMKGLSIQPPFATSLSTSLVSEPSSPSFIKPQIPAMKRKPSQLSLKTDGHGLNIRSSTIEIPPSPAMPPIGFAQRRALKHSTSSPQMLSGMKSAGFGPAGGMTFPTLSERGQSGLSEILRPTRLNSSSGNNRASIIMEEDSSPIRSQQASCAAMDFEPFRDESEANEDQKSPGYPDGPIAIYDDNVYLYLEPSAEEASKFDVVINVAREVLNPFNFMSSGQMSPDSPIPDTAVTSDSFSTAFEYPMDDRQDTPTTPKATNPFHEPEYIHMPWDHNTDIASDLMELCETIEKRTKEGKRVLIHCQQGASRSASLIIAYGLYQNPGISVNDAYHAAQEKSRWISPNMKLMYCLQDFQKEIAKRRMPRSAAGLRGGKSPTKHRLTLSANAIDMTPKEPLSAPLPEDSPRQTEAKSPERSPKYVRGKSTPNLEAISPGPSSAPSTFSWSEKDVMKRFPPPRQEFKSNLSLGFPPARQELDIPRQEFKPPPSPGFGAHRFGKGPSSLGFSSLGFGSMDSSFGQMGASFNHDHVEEPAQAPVHVTRAFPEDDALMSPRAETMTNNPLHDSFGEMAGLKFVEVPPTPPAPSEGLFSPRQMGFPRDPFQSFVRPTQVADPRSPPMKGEAPIVRSIDELLE
ncbi:dual specificity phosphatase [Truncatella angustata]|uniref:protein-tyrosine-phosphatase n=1 Tax=Truncatella angustata TaxID=152316 RepID=A0A9P8UKZ9_9PEZI|nr:dual specificity phosphatase [Truncatella angustata]KAH6654134.1 dual specificity phosphatase [Truncatella angustata]